MKKTAVIIIALAMLLSFAACGGSKSAPAPVNVDIAVENSGYVYGYQLKDGTYEIEVDSSASMFKVVHCDLVVKDGTMKAVISMSGDGYGYVYLGKADMAAADSEDKYIPFGRDSEDRKSFDVPVTTLDCEMDVAAYSIKKDTWYDRVLVFESALIPEDAYRAIRTANVTISGGTGKAGIKSPTLLAEDGGKYVAVIEWSSPNYTYMEVDGVRYCPINSEGNSTFAVPVELDKDMAVSAETAAMSQPHVIEYTLRFDGASLRDR